MAPAPDVAPSRMHAHNRVVVDAQWRLTNAARFEWVFRCEGKWNESRQKHARGYWYLVILRRDAMQAHDGLPEHVLLSRWRLWADLLPEQGTSIYDGRVLLKFGEAIGIALTIRSTVLGRRTVEIGNGVARDVWWLATGALKKEKIYLPSALQRGAD